VTIVNTSRADTFAFSEVIESVAKTVADICELTEAEISQVVGGSEKGGHNSIGPDSVKGGHD
jgi:hypothetical protein